MNKKSKQRLQGILRARNKKKKELELQQAEDKLKELDAEYAQSSEDLIALTKQMADFIALEKQSAESPLLPAASVSNRRDTFSSKPYSYFDDQARVVQGEVKTYCEEPQDADDYKKWDSKFLLDENVEKMEKLFDENEDVEENNNGKVTETTKDVSRLKLEGNAEVKNADSITTEFLDSKPVLDTSPIPDSGKPDGVPPSVQDSDKPEAVLESDKSQHSGETFGQPFALNIIDDYRPIDAFPPFPPSFLLKKSKPKLDTNVGKEPMKEVASISEDIIPSFSPEPVLGQQIAINVGYLCYALTGGTIEVVSRIRPGLKASLNGHSQIVADMDFFSEQVNLLATISLDGRILVWLLSLDQSGIINQKIIDLQISKVQANVHPRLKWHLFRKEILLVTIDGFVVQIDTTSITPAHLSFSVDDAPIDGVQFLGTHTGSVTDLSICELFGNKILLASSCTGGFVNIWEEEMIKPITSLSDYRVEEVWSVQFVKFRDRPGYNTILTGGYRNCQIMIWCPADIKTGWIRSTSKRWICKQTLMLTSCVEQESFFNKVIPIFNSHWVVIANSYSNDVYGVRLNYGSCPSDTRLEYLARFTVSEPILSFVARGEAEVELYCIHKNSVKVWLVPSPMVLEREIQVQPKIKASSELESVVNREIRALFQPNGSGREAINQAVRLSVSEKIVPKFGATTKGMFDHLATTFEKGMAEHTSHMEEQFRDLTNSVMMLVKQEHRDHTNSVMMLVKQELDRFFAKLSKGKVTASEDSPLPS